MTTNAVLYLSRLILNPSSRQVWSELAHPYEMHRTLMNAFPKATDEKKAKAREEFGVLFRADVEDNHNRVIVYVQSAVKPDWALLNGHKDYLYEHVDNPACKEITSTYQQLQKDQVLSFRLRANPTKRVAKPVKGDKAIKGKRVGLLREKEQFAWLIRKGQEREKGQAGGFELLTKCIEDENGEIQQIPRVSVQPEGKQNWRKKEGGHSHKTTHLAVRFDGLLRITDAEAFRQTLARGIGPAKAFGFGLLSIAPSARSSLTP